MADIIDDVQGDLSFPGTFTFREINPPSSRPEATCSGWLTRPPVPTAGYGGWSRVARPRKKAITEWAGRDSMSIEFGIMFDSFTSEMDNPGMYVETQIRALERLGGIEENDPRPPLFQVASTPPKLIPHNVYRAGHVQWFVESIQWEADSVIVNSVGNRTRSAATVVITQYVADETLQRTAAQRKKAATKKNSRGGSVTSYVVKRGDTLSKIAKRRDVYNDASKWRIIGRANHIRDPKNVKLGQRLKIP
jgi:LysM repeat protein